MPPGAQHFRWCAAVAFALTFCVLAAHSARAEIYRWTDEQGTLYFTSDLSQVPVQFRNQDAVAVPSGNIIHSGENDTRSSAQRVRAMEKRTRKLSKQAANRGAHKKATKKSTEADDPEPRKYTYNCRERTRNGRCRRHRTAEWDHWNERQQRRAANSAN